MDKRESATNEIMNEKGIVYVLSNEMLPGLFKIGRTKSGGLINRIRTLNTACPKPFQLVIAIETDNAKEIENEFHILLNGYRQGPREFFRIEPENIIPLLIQKGKNITNDFIKSNHQLVRTVYLKEVEGRYIIDGDTILDNRYFEVPKISEKEVKSLKIVTSIIQKINMTAIEAAIIYEYMCGSDIIKTARKLKITQICVRKYLERINTKLQNINSNGII